MSLHQWAPTKFSKKDVPSGAERPQANRAQWKVGAGRSHTKLKIQIDVKNQDPQSGPEFSFDEL